MDASSQREDVNRDALPWSRSWARHTKLCPTLSIRTLAGFSLSRWGSQQWCWMRSFLPGLLRITHDSLVPLSKTQATTMLMVCNSKHLWHIGQIRSPTSLWHKSPEMHAPWEHVSCHLSSFPPTTGWPLPRNVPGPLRSPETKHHSGCRTDSTGLNEMTSRKFNKLSNKMKQILNLINLIPV